MSQTRPAGVSFTAVVQILGSVVLLLISVITLLTPALVRNSQTPRPTTPMAAFYGLAAVYGLFAVLGFLTAIGLFRMRRWARYSTLAFSPFPIVVGVSFALLFVYLPLHPPGVAGDASAETAMKFARILFVSLGVLLAAIGISWLIYFNRQSVRLAFQNPTDQMGAAKEGLLIAGRQVPLSIAVIAGLWLFGSLFVIPTAFMRMPLMCFGTLFRGTSAVLGSVVLGLVQVCIAVGLFRLKNWAAGRDIHARLVAPERSYSYVHACFPAAKLLCRS